MGARRPHSAAERRSMLNPTTLAATPTPTTKTSSLPFTSTSTSTSNPPFPADTTIVLIHGLGRTPRSMSLLASRLEKATGLRAKAVGYPSRRLSVAGAARVVAERAAEACGGPGKPAFAVTFSLGGPVLRHAAALGRRASSGDDGSGGYSSSSSSFPPPPPSPDWVGSVLLAPPNRGSDLARALLHSPSTPRIVRTAFEFIYGPAVLDLALPADEIERSWPDAPRPCGVVAGTAPRSLNPASLLLASRVFRGERGNDDKGEKQQRGRRSHRDCRRHDGTVAVDETALRPPADDFASVHAGHTFLADSAETAELVASFVLRGRFRVGDGGGEQGEEEEEKER